MEYMITEKRKKSILAISGGPDSVYLLHTLLEQGEKYNCDQYYRIETELSIEHEVKHPMNDNGKEYTRDQ